MEHSANMFTTAEELAHHLVKSAVDIEIRAYCVMEHGKDSDKIALMKKIVHALRGKWSTARAETNWRLELLFNYKEFCVQHGILQPDKGELPVPATKKKKKSAPAKPKKE